MTAGPLEQAATQLRTACESGMVQDIEVALDLFLETVNGIKDEVCSPKIDRAVDRARAAITDLRAAGRWRKENAK